VAIFGEAIVSLMALSTPVIRSQPIKASFRNAYFQNPIALRPVEFRSTPSEVNPLEKLEEVDSIVIQQDIELAEVMCSWYYRYVQVFASLIREEYCLLTDRNNSLQRVR